MGEREAERERSPIEESIRSVVRGVEWRAQEARRRRVEREEGERERIEEDRVRQLEGVVEGEEAVENVLEQKDSCPCCYSRVALH